MGHIGHISNISPDLIDTIWLIVPCTLKSNNILWIYIEISRYLTMFSPLVLLLNDLISLHVRTREFSNAFLWALENDYHRLNKIFMYMPSKINEFLL